MDRYLFSLQWIHPSCSFFGAFSKCSHYNITVLHRCFIAHSPLPRWEMKLIAFNFFRYCGQMTSLMSLPINLSAAHVSTIPMDVQAYHWISIDSDHNHWYQLKTWTSAVVMWFSAGLQMFTLSMRYYWDDYMSIMIWRSWSLLESINILYDVLVFRLNSDDSQKEVASWCKLRQLVDKSFKVALIAFTSCRSQPPPQPLTVMIMQLDQWAKL